MSSRKVKASLYMPAEMLEEVQAEMQRLDRSMSWVVLAAWKIGRGKVRGLPSAARLEEEAESSDG